MKTLINLGLITVIFAACQPQAPKQYFTESAEIDIAKKGINAYLTSDWSTYKSLYADTAEIYFGKWGEPISIDSVIAIHSGNESVLSDLKFTGPGTDDPVYQMVVTDEGRKWVNFWGLWSGTFIPTGNKIETPVNISWRIENGLIVVDAAIFDNAPFVTESMKADQMGMEENME